MTNEQKMQLLRFIAGTIFQSKAQNTDITQIPLITNTGRWPGRMFKGDLRGFDFSLNLGDRIINLRCLEQNPNKTDNFGNLKKYAILARQGHKIMWVIDTKNNTFLGRLQDNVWYASFVTATTPAPAAAVNTDFRRTIYADGRVVTNYADGRHTEHMADNRPADYYEPPGTQVPAASQTEPMEIDELPEIPNGITVPDYVYDQIANMDEPPNWGDNE
jgi:hypothetical protein